MSTSSLTGRALGVVISCVSCGGMADQVDATPAAVPMPSSPTQPAPAGLRPPSGVASRGEGTPGEAPSAGDNAQAPGPPLPSEPFISARSEASSILRSFCGSCHGFEAIQNGNVQGGFDYVDDMDEMVRRGLVLPLRSSDSAIVRVMRDGSMPPPGVEPRPADDDINHVAQYIDNPLAWPDDILTPAPAVDGGSADLAPDAG